MNDLRAFLHHLPRLVVFLFLGSCVDRLEFDKSDFDNNVDQVVIDGSISDNPGPYTVRVFKSSNADDILNFREGINAKKVTILDDLGNEEVLQGKLGFYFTDPNGIRGEIGRRYHVKVELFDGRVFESAPDELKPTGKLDSIYYELESFQPNNGSTEYGFRIYVDSESPSENDNFIRWKYTGAYRASSDQGRCWAYLFEDGPTVSDNAFVSNGQFKNVEVAYVPVTKWTFFEKFMVRIDQISLSKTAFDFWSTVQSQKEGAASLFQPSFGKPLTNIFETSTHEPANGIFYASAIDTKIMFIERKEIPFLLPPILFLPEGSCVQIFPNSTFLRPEGWVD